jgi:hypothetical protein
MVLSCFRSPIRRYGLIVAVPQTGVVTADAHFNLLLAGTSHFLWHARRQWAGGIAATRVRAAR